MLAAVANSAESSQLLQRLSMDPRQSCTLQIKGGCKNLTESSSFIFQPFVLPNELPFQVPQPHLDRFLGVASTCSAHGHAHPQFTATQDG